jgi:hypothetical protein
VEELRLKVLDKRMLRRTCQPQRKRSKQNGENDKKKSFII